MTDKKRIAIVDDYGEHIQSFYVPPETNGFEGADLTGLQGLSITNLRGKSFKGANLY